MADKKVDRKVAKARQTPVAAKPRAPKPVVSKPVVSKPVVSKPVVEKVAPKVEPEAVSVAAVAVQPAEEAVVQPAPADQAIIEPAVEEAVETARVIEEGTSKMQNDATQAVTDRVQAIFGDVNERARALIEKNNRLVEEFTELTRGNVEAFVASSKVAARGVEALGQEAADYGRKSFEEASTALRSFAEVKSPTDLFRLQSEFAKTQFDSIVAESSRMSEAMLKLAGEMFEPLSSRYSVAAERVKSVVAA